MKPKKPHGGKREGAGRKPIYKVPMGRYTVRLTAEQVKFAEKLGGGDMAEGVRVALDAAKKTFETTGK